MTLAHKMLDNDGLLAPTVWHKFPLAVYFGLRYGAAQSGAQTPASVPGPGHPDASASAGNGDSNPTGGASAGAGVRATGQLSVVSMYRLAARCSLGLATSQFVALA